MVDRGTIRLALSKILDYARYVQPDSMAMLVQHRPSADLCALLTTNHVNLIWPEGGEFGRAAGLKSRHATRTVLPHNDDASSWSSPASAAAHMFRADATLLD
jgi:hypothetical protein